jgi:hypothetical protein
MPGGAKMVTDTVTMQSLRRLCLNLHIPTELAVRAASELSPLAKLCLLSSAVASWSIRGHHCSPTLLSRLEAILLC